MDTKHTPPTDDDLRANYEPEEYECGSCRGTGRIKDEDELGRDGYRQCLDCRGNGIDRTKAVAIQHTPPTEAAMRAARAINTSHEDSLTEDIMARIIDAETGHRELVAENKALREALILLARLAYQPYGAFSRDRLEAANNCLDALKQDATTVLTALGVDPTPLSIDEYYKFEDSGFSMLAACEKEAE